MILMHLVKGDLIGWNRTRNTAHKHMLVRNKIGNSALLNQYRQFYQIQKLKSAVVKNKRKRSTDQSNAGDRHQHQQQHKQKSGRFNRLASFRNFHA